MPAPTPEKLCCWRRRAATAPAWTIAVQTVERALSWYGAPVYVRKEIVHNEHVVAQLRERGAVFVDEFDKKSIPEDAITVFSAHGVSPGACRGRGAPSCARSTPRARS